MEAGYNGADRRLAYLFENANNVSFEPSLTAGTAVGTLTIDGEDMVLYAPTGGSASVAYTPIRTSGEAVGTLTINETDYTVYAPNTAEDISYDPTDSGLTATDVQAAVDEVAGRHLEWVTVASGTANTTYASQLAEIYAAYTTLSAEERNLVRLKGGSNGRGYLGRQYFFMETTLSTGQVNFYQFNIEDCTYYTVKTVYSTNATTLTDRSEYVYSKSLILQVLRIVD